MGGVTAAISTSRVQLERKVQADWKVGRDIYKQDMPFRSKSASSSQLPSTASGILQGTQTLGAIASPNFGNNNIAQGAYGASASSGGECLGPPNAGQVEEARYKPVPAFSLPPSPSLPLLLPSDFAGSSVSDSGSGLGLGSRSSATRATMSSASSSNAFGQNAHNLETPKKHQSQSHLQAYDRGVQVLHMNELGQGQGTRMNHNAYASPQSQAQSRSRSQSQSQQSYRQDSYASTSGPDIHLHQATPRGQSTGASSSVYPAQGLSSIYQGQASPSSYQGQASPSSYQGQGQGQGQASSYASASSSSVNLTGALQPGTNSTPSSATSYNAPTMIPTMPPINTNAQQYTPSSARSTTLQPSHSHSRSSPAGLDQKYIPFSATTPTSKTYSPQTPSMGASHSPLGLSDIRPRYNPELGTEAYSTHHVHDYPPTQTKCNYIAPWATYAYDWCKWPVHNGNSCGKMAVASYLEDPHNFIQILDTQMVSQDVSSPGVPPFALDFVKVAEATCAYPVTRISWEPPSSSNQSTDLLATSGDHLRLWSLPQSQQSLISSSINRSSAANQRDPGPQKLQPLALLSNSKTPEHTAPLTSLDWNTLSPNLIITSSIDTTCTIWDIPTLTAKTQLIAHDKEVFDVRFCAGSVDVFVSCGADGSVRMFDLRSLEHSTIIYEPSDKSEKVDKSMLRDLFTLPHQN